MRFLADENFLGDAVMELQASGHDIAWIKTVSPSADDREVLHRAEIEQRILLTFDKDFGELAWRYGLPATCGIVLFRLRMQVPATIGRSIAEKISKRTDWAGYFSVVEPARIRRRRLTNI